MRHTLFGLSQDHRSDISQSLFLWLDSRVYSLARVELRRKRLSLQSQLLQAQLAVLRLSTKRSSVPSLEQTYAQFFSGAVVPVVDTVDLKAGDNLHHKRAPQHL